MILWLLLFNNLVFAQETSVEEFCFSSASQLMSVKGKMKGILLPVDQMTTIQNCFTIQTPPHRRELIQSYVKRLDPTVSISFSSAEIKRDPCNLVVERIKHQNMDQTTLGASTQLTANQSAGTRSASETMRIQTLSKFELSYNQDVIEGECRFITPNKYEITLQVRTDPKPLLPPLPAGSTVIIQDAARPADQQTSSLKTELQMNRGEKIEIGSVIKKAENKEHTVSANPELAIKDGENVQSEKVFLSLE